MTDVIDRLAGLEPGGRTALLRRPVTRENAQAAFDALFTADLDEAAAAPAERTLVAVFVAALHGDAAAVDLYAGLARAAAGDEATDAVLALAGAARAEGPYGAYPDGPLAGESVDGPRFAVPDAAAAGLGERLAAALEHAHLLVFRPRESSPEALERLAAAGWSVDGIVTLSQLVSFLAFQLRVAHGLRALAAFPVESVPAATEVPA